MTSVIKESAMFTKTKNKIWQHVVPSLLLLRVIAPIYTGIDFKLTDNFQSKVPLALWINVASLRGTLRVQIKPPPSDQLWFGFTSMPEIDVHLESSVGDHKVTSGHIASFLINRFKVLNFSAAVLSCLLQD